MSILFVPSFCNGIQILTMIETRVNLKVLSSSTNKSFNSEFQLIYPICTAALINVNSNIVPCTYSASDMDSNNNNNNNKLWIGILPLKTVSSVRVDSNRTVITVIAHHAYKNNNNNTTTTKSGGWCWWLNDAFGVLPHSRPLHSFTLNLHLIKLLNHWYVLLFNCQRVPQSIVASIHPIPSFAHTSFIQLQSYPSIAISQKLERNKFDFPFQKNVNLVVLWALS